MCGIVGYTGNRPAAPIVLRGLHDLEYRGYDSAGIATLEGLDGIQVVKREGKLANLERSLSGLNPLTGFTGMGHTRWATHGKPNDRNAHPHASCAGEVVVIHNGIVENYAALRAELAGRGHTLASDTDTETIAHLLEEQLGNGSDLLLALRTVVARLEGSQAIVAMTAREPGVLVAARMGNAGGVVVGYGEGEVFLSSDLAAVLPHTQRVAFLADGELVRVEPGDVTAQRVDGSGVELEVRQVPFDPVTALKGEYQHFMLKEIMEQPGALADTVQSLVSVDPPELTLEHLASAADRLATVERVVLVGMGSSLHAAMIGRSYIEAIAGVPAEVDNASEFRYRDPILDERTLVVSVSQSGETVDVLEAMAVARAAGAVQITICNTEGAQTTRVADGTVYTRAGLERGVASTKCLSTAMVALYALALQLADAKGRLSREQLASHVQILATLPSLAGRITADAEASKAVAARLASARDMLFLGRGAGFPLAMEGALKMKEISYIHAEGYAAGEMKHGPIALIEPGFPVVAVATRHALREKLISNMEQIRAREGDVIALATSGDHEVAALASNTLWVPDVPALLEPIVSLIPLQLLSYYVAIRRGCDVDQPRNLAKTVTVE